MDLEKAGWVVCLTIIIVVGINAAIYASLKRGTTIGQIELFRRAAERARDPWKIEDESLKELARQVSAFKAEKPGQSKKPENSSQHGPGKEPT